MLRTRTLQDHLRTDIHLGFILFVQLFLLLLLSSASSMSDAATAGEVRLAWNAVNDSRVARYEVHYGTASKTYESKVQVTTASATVSGPGRRLEVFLRNTRMHERRNALQRRLQRGECQHSGRTAIDAGIDHPERHGKPDGRGCDRLDPLGYRQAREHQPQGECDHPDRRLERDRRKPAALLHNLSFGL